MAGPKNSLWYKDAVIYQLHVKTFYDANGDGVGDFQGLIEKLPYLKELGVTAIWVLPFYPSPLKDDGYDIADYYDINPQYGTLKDFRKFLKVAHSLDLKIITELVINHTSDQHRWFKRAKESEPGSKYRNYYVWSDSADKYRDARIIFKDFEISNWTWDEQAQAYYWHRFYSHQPDLNFESTEVQKAIFRVVDFWFSMGVDGMRLDAVPYLYEEEGTNCENLPKTHQFLKKLRKYVDSKFRNKMLLAEANQWPEDAVTYFGKGHGDECHMAFHFPLMPRMYMALQMEESFPIIDILEQTPSIPKMSQWAIFLRNHDELTLEMVTDEERDYMYRAYAQDSRARINLGIRRRLVPLLSKNRIKVELMNVLLFSLPGTPVIYYGDEIGMGDNHFLGDRDGVRTPMQWSYDRNAGFSKVNPQQLYLPVIIDSEYHYETVNVETEIANRSSLLWWMKRIIAMRKRFKAFSLGDIKFVRTNNSKVLTFLRVYKDEVILVVVNLSRFSQPVALDLHEYSNYVPEELFSSNDFPIISNEVYNMTMASHSHFWFLLKEVKEKPDLASFELKRFALKKSWNELFASTNLKQLEEKVFPQFLKRMSWFVDREREIISVELINSIILDANKANYRILFLNVSFNSGSSQVYQVPVGVGYLTDISSKMQNFQESIICELTLLSREGALYDAISDLEFRSLLLRSFYGIKKGSNQSKNLKVYLDKDLKNIAREIDLENLSSRLINESSSNSCIVYEEKVFVKIFRRISCGYNPEVEISRYFSQLEQIGYVPKFLGTASYTFKENDETYLAFMQRYIPAQCGGEEYFTFKFKEFYEDCFLRMKSGNVNKFGITDVDLKSHYFNDVNHISVEIIELTAQRTAQMHSALAMNLSDDKDFKPESFSLLYQRSLCQSMGARARLVLEQLRNNISKLSVDDVKDAELVISFSKQIQQKYKKIIKFKLSAKKIRIHGDYRLQQLIFTGKDFVIIDFEGEVLKPLSERRLKRSALVDLASFLRSFHYVAYKTLLSDNNTPKHERFLVEKAADSWYSFIVDTFVNSYLSHKESFNYLPSSRKDVFMLISLYLLDRAIYELGHELEHRPEYVIVALRGVLHALSFNV